MTNEAIVTGHFSRQFCPHIQLSTGASTLSDTWSESGTSRGGGGRGGGLVGRGSGGAGYLKVSWRLRVV